MVVAPREGAADESAVVRGLQRSREGQKRQWRGNSSVNSREGVELWEGPGSRGCNGDFLIRKSSQMFFCQLKVVDIECQCCCCYGNLTLSCPGPHLDRVLSLAIHTSPTDGPIDMISSGKLAVCVLAMHCAL
jgi:hypothetical protein